MILKLTMKTTGKSSKMKTMLGTTSKIMKSIGMIIKMLEDEFMGWDDDRREDPILEWDYLDYMNKTGIYEETDIEDDPEDDLYLAGLDPDELEDMDDDARRSVIEDAGLDPDDYDFVSSGSYSSRRQSQHTATNTYKTSNQVSPQYSTRPANNKWSLVEFIIFITIISIIGFAIAAIGGELIATIVIIIIAIVVMSCF